MALSALLTVGNSGGNNGLYTTLHDRLPKRI
jgi:hypothetical protein